MVKIKEKVIVLSDEEILEISHNIHVKYILDKDISEEEALHRSRSRCLSICAESARATVR